jgi:cobalt-zinc-cadmium efflux system protein
LSFRPGLTFRATKQSLVLAMFLTIAILIIQLVGAFLANSLSLFSDADFIIFDIFALGLAWLAAVQAERPPNARNTYGYHRWGVLIAVPNALTPVIFAFIIIWEAIRRFQHPQSLQPYWSLFWTTLFASHKDSTLINVVSAFLGSIVHFFQQPDGLHPVLMILTAGISIIIKRSIDANIRSERGDIVVRSASLHITDLIASIGIIVAALFIFLTGYAIADTLLSALITIVIAYQALRVLNDAIHILLEATPVGLSVVNLVRDIREIAGVHDVLNLHIWSITSNMIALSCHVVIDDLRLNHFCGGPKH